MSVRMSQIWFVMLLGLTLAMAAFFWTAFNPTQGGRYWPIQWIEVSGAFERVSSEQVRAVAAPLLDRGFFVSDMAEVRRELQDLPWVQRVEATKVWPDKVSLTVYEHQPLGSWGEGQLISESGELFAVGSGYLSSGLPKFSGVDQHAPEIVTFYRDITRLLQGSGLWLDQVDRSERGAWTLMLSNGLEVKLGSVEPLQRFERMLTAMNEIEMDAMRQAVSVDLRYTNGFAVTWAEQEEPVVVAAVAPPEES